jgi:hypothetical protein
MKKIQHPLLWLTILVGLLACDAPQKESLSARAYFTAATKSDMPSRRELMDAFRARRAVLVVYASQNEEALEQYAELAQQIGSRRGMTIEVKPCKEVTAEDWRDKAIVLIGTKHSNSVLRKVLKQLPLRLGKDEIAFGDQTFTDDAIGMLAFYPNPLQPTMPLSLLTATSDQAVLDFLQKKLIQDRRFFGWSSWNYEFYEKGQRVLLGMFNPETWAMDKKIHFDFSGALAPMAETNNFRFLAPEQAIDQNAIRKLAQTIQANADAIRDFINPNATLPVVNFHLYATAEEKALMLNNADHAHVSHQTNAVHTVFDEAHRENLIGKENELLIRHLLGKPQTAALERGLAIHFTDQWQFKGYEHWAARLFASGNMLALSDLLTPEIYFEESPLVTGCLSASFVDFLLAKFGKDTFLEKYPHWSPEAQEIAALEREWHQYLRQQASNIDVEKTNTGELPYLKGFNFAHEGYAIYNGYMSKLATEAIAKQSDQLNCNALAVIPYSYMRDPRQPSFIPIVDGAGSENDQSVIHSALAAKAKGMTVMLKPQLWLGGGNWPGDVEMTSEADWQAFFTNYHRWMRHYALLAEIWQMDVLCIGTELAKTTHAREQDWRALVGRIRGLYSGKLTYAANWGSEFEKFPFADALDYLGVDCYYPLSKNPDATKAELQAGFADILTKLEAKQREAGKPLIFTEIGFRSTDAPWQQPHEPSRRGDDNLYNGEHQELCYEVVLEAIRDQPWIGGIFWWKFPSYIEHREDGNDDFTPNRKPAEKVIRQWFAKMP